MTVTRFEIGQELNRVSTLLWDKQDQLGILIAEEFEKRTESLKTSLSLGESVSHAERLADQTLVGEIIRINKLKGEIAALITKRDHLQFMVKYGLEGAVNGESVLSGHRPSAVPVSH